MTTQENRGIDWEIAYLDGGLFDGRWLSRAEPRLDVVAPAQAPASRRPMRLTAAGLAGGVLLTSFCAMAFHGSLSGAARIPVVRPHPFAPMATPERAQLAAGAGHDDTESAETPHDEAVPVTAAMPAAPAAESPAPRTLHEPSAATPVAAPLVLPPGSHVLPSRLAVLGEPDMDIDRASVALAFALAGRGAAGCVERGDARRSVPVSVTFSPSGSVTSASVDGGPFVSTAAGRCIAGALRSANVHRFQGNPVTIHGSIHLP